MEGYVVLIWQQWFSTLETVHVRSLSSLFSWDVKKRQLRDEDVKGSTWISSKILSKRLPEGAENTAEYISMAETTGHV
jgi:hypothetical protein